MSAVVAYALNRYSRVQMNTASLNYAPIKGCACSSLKGVPLHCIIFRTATETAITNITRYTIYVDRNSEDAQLEGLTNKMVQAGRSAACYSPKTDLAFS